MFQEALVEHFGSEVSVLVDAPMDDVESVVSSGVADAIRAFREGGVVIKPGGGGQYGSISIPGGEESLPVERQKSLFDF